MRNRFLICAIALTASAQRPPQAADPVIRVSTTLVQIQALVTDSAGHHVATLTPADFTLLQDGKPQRITHFSYVEEARSPRSGSTKPELAEAATATPAPGSVATTATENSRAYAIVVDDLHTSPINLARVKPELRKFLENEVRPGDLVSISTARGDTGASANFTTSKADLATAIDRSTFRSGTPARQEGDCTADLVYFESTLNRLSAVIRTLSERPGRKSAILITDGLVIPQRQSICEAQGLQMNTDIRNLANQAVRAGVALYMQGTAGIDIVTHDASWSSHAPPGTVIPGGPDDMAAKIAKANVAPAALMRDTQAALQAAVAPQEVADFLSSQTGGYFSRLSNDLTDALQKAIDDMSGYYLLGYEPAAEDFELKNGAPQWHAINVRVNQPGLTVRATGGFSGSPYGTAGPSSNVRQQIEEAFFSGGELNGLATRLRAEFFKEGDKATLTVTARVDLSKLPFRKESDRSRDDLTMIVGVFDQNGNFISATQKIIEMRLKDNTLDTLARTGYSNSTDFTVPPGKYLIRLLVRDSEGQAMAKQSTGVDIPW